MVVGLLRLDVHVPGAQSLKDKRSVVKRLKDQLRERFNVAVAEVDANDTWQRATLGLSTVGEDRACVQGLLSQATEWIRMTRLVELIQVDEEYLSANEGDG
jgi:uncharacterized protein YlxP (DUF503 family)